MGVMPAPPPQDAAISRVSPPHRTGIEIVLRDLAEGLSPTQIAQKHRVPLHRVLFFRSRIQERMARLKAEDALTRKDA
ncbi:hypothetical protein EMVG_00042 [Emiliania huxleyi virus PS401]|nr:hypothetical protein EMVG_00042 [Emiliania huxleyi virus PS401]